MRVVLDTEANGLFPTRIHCVVTKDIDTNETITHLHPFKSLKDLLAKATLVVGHHCIKYDLYHLNRLLDVSVPRDAVVDTLVLSRLYEFNLEGGHSLENWGKILKHPKIEYDQWEYLTNEMIERCIGDVELNHKVYTTLRDLMKLDDKDSPWLPSVDCEMKMEWICHDMHVNGFSFNKDRAIDIYKEIAFLCEEMDIEIKKVFKPKTKFIKEVTPRLTKHGTLHRQDFRWYKSDDYTIFQPDAPFSRFSWEEFKPTSQKQVCERLKDYWEPTDKTDAHIQATKDKDEIKLEHHKVYGWKVSEINLATLKPDAPEAARLLVKRLLLNSRLNTLNTWLENYNTETGKVHGTFNSIGTWTHRLSHTNPNLGNVSAEKTIKYKSEELRSLAIHYGGEMRKLWLADSDSWLVGCDMEGAHLRLFAHFIKDESLVQALVSGDKRLGTDPHTLNKQKLGYICPDRDLAKTFIFTYLNGGGVGKVMEIFRCPHKEARHALDEFIASYPGLADLKRNQIPRLAKQGWFKGLDGRKVRCDSEHLMIAGLLQNGEAVVVKNVVVKSMERFHKEKLPVSIVNIVHDEIQYNVRGDEDLAKYVGNVSSELFTQIGKELNITCPLAGEVNIGRNWLESH